MGGKRCRAVFVAMLTVMSLAACGGASPADGHGVAWVEPSFTGASDLPTTVAPTPKPTVKATPKPTKSPTKKPTPKPTPTKKPPASSLPPPPNKNPKPAPSATGANCPRYSGTKAPMSDVKAALTAAATTRWWDDVSNMDPNLNGERPEITVPLPLMKAIAWQESGWQSTIIACDGGLGTMQIMPDTASWMNGRFGTSHNVNTLAGNTAIGAEYVQWLILYFGLYYFGGYDLDLTASVGPDGSELSLLDVVVAAYNVGPAAIENAAELSIPNQRYVDNVEALMTSCECLSF